LSERCRRHGQHYEREQQRTNRWDDTHCASSCPFILGLPGDAVLLRVAWMEGTISGRNVLNDSVSFANSSVRNLLILGVLSLVNNAQFEKLKLARRHHAMARSSSLPAAKSDTPTNFAINPRGRRKNADVLV
jgi:hypothetical protein